MIRADDTLRANVRTGLARFGFSEAASWLKWPELVTAVVEIVQEDRRERSKRENRQ